MIRRPHDLHRPFLFVCRIRLNIHLMPQHDSAYVAAIRTPSREGSDPTDGISAPCSAPNSECRVGLEVHLAMFISESLRTFISGFCGRI